MHEIFEFRKELNIKKIIFVVLIFIIILIFIILKFFIPKDFSNTQLSENINSFESNESIFYSSNQKISLKLSNDYNFIQYKPKNDYILELRNSNNLGIFISEESLIYDKPLSEIVKADFDAYVAQFNNSTNVSNISEFDRGGFPAYTYSFHYLDSQTRTGYYLQTIWLENNNKYYIIDIEFPANTLNENSKIINDILNSIIIN